MGKNWWEDDRPVQTAGRSKNWWEDDAPVAGKQMPTPQPLQQARERNDQAIASMAPGAGVVRQQLPPAMLARPGFTGLQAPTPAPAIDPLAKGGVPTGRRLDPNDPFNNTGGPKPMEAVQPNRNWNDKAADWMSENLTPLAENAGRGIASRLLPFEGSSEMVAGITGGLAQWGSTAVKDPYRGANEAVQMLEPTHHIAYGYNDLRDSLSALFKGDTKEAYNKYMEATPELLGGTLGVMPVGSMTVSALQKMAKGGPSISSQLFRPGPTAVDRAADILIKKMKADGLTVDDLRRVQRSLANRGDSGVYETLSEVAGLSDKSSGANLRGLAMALGAVPGPAQEALIARVAENADKLPSRLNRAATRATGQKADEAVSTLDELDQRLKTEAGPAYDNFYASQIDPKTFETQIFPTLNTAQGKEAARSALNGLETQEAALRAAVASGEDAARPALERVTASVRSLQEFVKNPLGGVNPTPEALDHIKRAFDDQIEAAGQRSYTGKNLRSAKNNFSEAVSRATGGAYGEALGTYEGISRLQEAFDFGVNSLNKKTWELKYEMDKGLMGRAWSQGEVEAIAMGVARAIEDAIEAGDNAALTKLMKGKALKNIGTALGDEKAAAMFEESMNRLAANREWGRRVAGGSDTAMRQAAIKDATTLEEDPVTRTLERAKNSTAPPTFTGAVWGAVGKPVMEKAQDAYRRFKYPGIYDEEVNAALAPIMSSPLTNKPLDELSTLIEGRLGPKPSGPRLPAPSSPPAVGGPKGRANSIVSPAAVMGLAGATAAGNEARAQTQEIEAQLADAQKSIRDIEASLAAFAAMDVGQKQEFLAADKGLYTKPDRKMGPDTARRIKEWQDAKSAELESARARLKEAEKRAAFEKTRPAPWAEGVREAAPWLAFAGGGIAGKLMRSGAVKAAEKKALQSTASANALLNKAPVKPAVGPAQERALHQRYANVNKFWSEGGAGKDVPFKTTTSGEWRGQKAADPTSLYPEPSKYMRTGDAAVMGTAAAEGAASQFIAVPAAQKELEAAQAAVDKDPSEANLTRLENARTMLAIANSVARAGFGVAVGRGAGVLSKPYKSARPNIADAEAERAALLALSKKKPGGGGPPPSPPGPKGPRILSSSGPKAPIGFKAPANDTLPKGQQTPAQDLAMARAFNKEPLTAERAYDFWTLLKDETDPRKIMDVLDMNLDPAILRVPRGKAMVERAREEVLRRATSLMRKETERNKGGALSRANAKMAENNRAIANEIAQLRERGVPDQMIARSLGLEDGSLEYFSRWKEPTLPKTNAPAQGGGALANAEKILSDPRVASQLTPEQFQPLYDTIAAQMQKLQSKMINDPLTGRKISYANTQAGSNEIQRLNGLLLNYMKTPDGGMDFGKVFKRAEATDPDRTMRVQAGRAANDVEDGVTTSDAIDMTPDGYERTSQIGNATLKYSVGTDNKTMTLDVIEVPPNARGQKEASKALDALLAQADANKLTVYLDAKPIGKGGMDEAQLRTFYAKRGFTKQAGGTGMVRSPNGSN